jgi:hypothetical protein
VGPNERLERSQWDFFWAPADAETIDRPEVAALRCPRKIAHLNAVTRTRAVPARVDALVEEMQAWLPHDIARWMVPDTFDAQPLERALEASEWRPVGRYEARAMRPSDYARRTAHGFDVRRVDSLETLRDGVRVMSQAFGRDMPFTEDELAADLRQCADPGGRIHRFVVYRGDRPIASGGLNWYPELRFAFLWAGGTVPDARGAGAYTALVAERIRHAAAMGAEWAGLYAKDDTSAPIVARQGLACFGEMSYWAPEA